jgi:hypothetical protein
LPRVAIAAALAVALGAPTSSASAQVAAGWGIKTGRSGLDSSALVDLTMRATPPAAGWSGSVIPTLDLRCVEHALWVMIQTGPPNPHSSGADKALVAYQIDNDARVSQQWDQVHSGNAFTAPDAKAFIRRLSTAKKLHVEAPAVDGNTPVFEFPVTGLAQSIAPLTATCPLTP